MQQKMYLLHWESCPSGLRCGSRKAVCLQSTVGSNPMLSVYCAVIVQYYPNKTSYLQFKKGVLYRQDSFFAVILSGTCSYCQTVDLCRQFHQLFIIRKNHQPPAAVFIQNCLQPLMDFPEFSLRACSERKLLVQDDCCQGCRRQSQNKHHHVVPPSLYPMPQTVSTYCGLRGSSSILFRSLLIWTFTAFSSPQ